MKTILKAAIFAGGILAVTPAFAGERTVVLEVSGMTCAVLSLHRQENPGSR